MPNRLLPTLVVSLMFVPPVMAQQPAPTAAARLAQQADQLESDGKRSEALGLYREILQKNPSDVEANLGAGRVLDLEGQYGEARRHLQKAIDSASDSELNGALQTMAISYAFEGNVGEATKHYTRVFDRQIAAGARDAAGTTANALGRVYLETGDAANAEKWYRTGYETALKHEPRTPEQTDLIEMRWHHAQARIAARRKQFDVARKHVAEVRGIVERGRLSNAQKTQYPYVAGYVEFYAGEYDKAIAELSAADQQDPFILGLLAQAHERKQSMAPARELYTKILATTAHSLQAAFTRPWAARRLAAR